MLEIIKSGGVLMIPIILGSIVAMGIVIERFWSLRRRRIVPENLVAQIWHWHNNKQINADVLKNIQEGSALGRILASGLINLNQQREIMKESIEETGRHVAHELERFLNTLGTIALISPLLGLLGTVIGMIQVFDGILVEGVGKPNALAGGISVALITTAAGLIVAIPAMMFHRYFRGKIDALVVEMEQEALKMVEIMHGDRKSEKL
ncbi:MAG: biopolymer transporter ExbB [Gammaproteobacteria bacterium RBG_16_57_12]|nr:MAG: biopolymer transporter ExbB [Gammaproteobacteria bacterium RBG_16_57_12]